MNLIESTVESGGTKLALRRWGDPARQTIVLVHGYPDCSHVWDAIAEVLAREFHVVAYDVRGAGRSDAPRATRDYALAQLAADTVAVVDAVSPDRPVHLVGHDWGSIQSWETVTTPELRARFGSYTSISGPCLDHAGHWLRRMLRAPGAKGKAARQLLSSWYMVLFHLPGAPLVWSLGLDKRWPRVLQRLEGLRVPHSPTQRRDGRLGINLYRANMLPCLTRPRERHTDVPVQLIVPLRDPFVTPELLDELPRWVPKLWRYDIDAGHWLPLSHPEWLASRIGDFVRFVEGGAKDPAFANARLSDTTGVPDHEESPATT